MAQQSGTGRESAPLEEIVQQEDDSEHQHHHIGKLWARLFTCDERTDVGTKPEGIVGYGTQQESYGHMETCIHSVGHIAIKESAQAIHDGNEGHDDTKAGLGDTVFRAQAGNRKREILANEIEQSISYHRDDDGTPLPIKETFGGLCGIHCLFATKVVLVYGLSCSVVCQANRVFIRRSVHSCILPIRTATSKMVYLRRICCERMMVSRICSADRQISRG